jgi:hypothetical protein
MVKETYNVCGDDGKVVRIVLSVVDGDEVGKGLKLGIGCWLHNRKKSRRVTGSTCRVDQSPVIQARRRCCCRGKRRQ